MECAGNGRGDSAPGERWTFRAFGRAKWTGVPLASFLSEVGRTQRDLEIGFSGWDPDVPFEDRQVPYQRSLPIDVALQRDVIMAFAMNGDKIPAIYGGPVRLIVPGWYGMASYKRPKEITVLEEPLKAPHQTERYIYDENGKRPVTLMNPRSVIMGIDNGFKIKPGDVLEGIAWSNSPITRVLVSLDGGESWEESLVEPNTWEGRHDRQIWRYQVLDIPRGEAVLLSRAIDALGATQPMEAKRTKFGYSRNDVFQQVYAGKIM